MVSLRKNKQFGSFREMKNDRLFKNKQFKKIVSWKNYRFLTERMFFLTNFWKKNSLFYRKERFIEKKGFNENL